MFAEKRYLFIFLEKIKYNVEISKTQALTTTFENPISNS